MENDSAVRVHPVYDIARKICILFITVSLAAHTANGQERDSVLAVGDRVRVITTVSPAVFEGTLTKITSQSLQLAFDVGAPTTLAFGEIENLYAFTERRNGGMGAATGGLIGASIGGVLGASISSRACESDEFCVRSAGSGMGILAGAALGSLMGVLVGRAIGMEIYTSSWQRVDLEVAARPTYDSSVDRKLEVRPSVHLVIQLDR